MFAILLCIEEGMLNATKTAVCNSFEYLIGSPKAGFFPLLSLAPNLYSLYLKLKRALLANILVFVLLFLLSKPFCEASFPRGRLGQHSTFSFSIYSSSFFFIVFFFYVCTFSSWTISLVVFSIYVQKCYVFSITRDSYFAVRNTMLYRILKI